MSTHLTSSGNARSRVVTDRRALIALGIAAAAVSLAPQQADAAAGRSLQVRVVGLPAGQSAAVSLRGPSGSRTVKATKTFRNLRAGRYVATVRVVRVARATSTVRAGATAYPAKRKVAVRLPKQGTRILTVRYAGIVNPKVRAVPNGILGVLGTPNAPSGLILPKNAGSVSAGSILTSGANAKLPRGLVSRVTSVVRQGDLTVASVTPVPIGEAVPNLNYAGALELTPETPGSGVTGDYDPEPPPSATGRSASPRSEGRAKPRASKCAGASALKFGASLDEVQVREASLDTRRRKARLTFAVRTTETLGASAAVAGVNCSFDVGNLGPYQAAVPVGPIFVPVFAQLPVTATASISGTLGAGVIHVASTTVASVGLGAGGSTSLTQQGSNVWVTGSPSIAGSAELSASIALEAGIGVAKGFNVHLSAGFGPSFTWSSGQPCRLVLDLGSLSAGVRIFNQDLNSPSFTAATVPIWSGCNPATTPTPPATAAPAPTTAPGPTPTPIPTPVPTPTPGAAPQAPTYAETTGGAARTWTNHTNAGGTEGPTIPAFATVQIACKLPGFRVADGNTWWYRIAQSPWDNRFYVSADAFYNNGRTSGSLSGTPFVDPAVRDC